METETVVETHAVEAYRQLEGDLPTEATQLVIASPVERSKAGVMLANLRTRIAAGIDLFKPMIDSAHKAHKAAIALRDQTLAKAKAADAALVRAMAAWDTKVAREEAEARRKQEEAVRLAAKETVAVAEAIKEEDPEGAEMVLATGRAAVQEAKKANPVPVATPTAGPSARTTYRAEVTSMRELVEAVAKGAVSLDVLEASMPNLNRLARAAAKEGPLCPGVKVVEEKFYVGRRS